MRIKDWDPLPHLQVLALWLEESAAPPTLGSAFEGLQSENKLPPDVRRAWEMIRAMRFDATVVSARALPIEGAVLAIADAFRTERDADVFWSRISLAPLRLDDIGVRMGLTRQRIAQLQQRAESRVRLALASPECTRLRWRMWLLRQRIGVMAPLNAPWVQKAVSELSAGVPEGWRLRLMWLALWETEPYKLDDRGWIIRASVPRHQIVDSAVAHDKSIDLTLLREQLRAHGVVQEAMDDWIAQFVPLREIERRTYLWRGSITDKAALLLAIAGKPLDPETMNDLINEGHDSRSLRLRLHGDSRFMRVERSRFALRTWDLDEYTGIADEIAEEITNLGGEGRVADVADAVASNHGVSASSVTTLMKAPRFVLADGRIRLRRSDEPYLIRRELKDEPRCYLLNEAECTLRIEVDEELLRGSGRRLPEGLGAWLGLSPDTRRQFQYLDQHLVQIGWSINSISGPSIGSLRAIAMSIEAEKGDWLVMRFDRDQGRVHATRTTAGDLEHASTDTAIRLLTGVCSGTGTLERQLAYAIGAESVQQLRELLRRRGEKELTQLLPQAPAIDLDEALDRLRDIL